ncbi:hypothetical protein M0R45_012695 [Rubus argutus]|uniref:Uncharacterized protein n=1 Tax=Rubus argutus TaxID=59490 RepID=A0AAW1XIE8_RUBAR
MPPSLCFPNWSESSPLLHSTRVEPGAAPHASAVLRRNRKLCSSPCLVLPNHHSQALPNFAAAMELQKKEKKIKRKESRGERKENKKKRT